MTKLVLNSLGVVAFLGLFFLSEPGFSSQRLEFSNCTESEVGFIQQSLENARPALTQWLHLLETEYGVDPQKSVWGVPGDQGAQPPRSAVEQAYDMVACIKQRSEKNLRFECGHDFGESSAKTWPLVGKTIQLAEMFFFLSYREGSTGTLIHELSHKCGGTDAVYFNFSSDPPYSTALSPWQFIADTYGWWYRNGLYIPSNND